MFYRRVVVERLQKLFCLGYAVRVPNRYLIGKIPNINKKSEPIPHREEVRISYVWWGKVDSNFVRCVYYNFLGQYSRITF